jgi:hypothetical protein
MEESRKQILNSMSRHLGPACLTFNAETSLPSRLVLRTSSNWTGRTGQISDQVLPGYQFLSRTRHHFLGLPLEGVVWHLPNSVISVTTFRLSLSSHHPMYAKPHTLDYLPSATTPMTIPRVSSSSLNFKLSRGSSLCAFQDTWSVPESSSVSKDWRSSSVDLIPSLFPRSARLSVTG